MTTDDIIDGLLHREGGYVDHPHDTGGATNWGITRGTLASWRKRAVTVAEVKALTKEEARDIYRVQYIDQPGFSTLPEPLRTHVVDFGVNAGQAQAVRTLQRVVGATQDGILGPRTRAALAALDVAQATRRYWQERVRFYARLVAIRPTQMAFLDGWLNRCFHMQP